MDPQIWTSKEIVAAVVATGVVSALAREGIDWFKAGSRRRRELRYLSVSAAVALEAFALECEDLATGMEADYANHKVVGSIGVPDPPIMPSDCDWRVVGISLMNEVLSFSNEVKRLQLQADFEYRHEGNSWSHVVAVKELGEKATAIAARLRERVGLS